jgi:hypothetical protein
MRRRLVRRLVRRAAYGLAVATPVGLIAAGHGLAAMQALFLTAAFFFGYQAAHRKDAAVIGRLLAALEGTAEANHQHRLMIANIYRRQLAWFHAGARPQRLP